MSRPRLVKELNDGLARGLILVSAPAGFGKRFWRLATAALDRVRSGIAERVLPLLGPLPLARLRARGHLAELRAAELRFTTEEAGVLLCEAVGPDFAVPDASVDALATRTEGWAAGPAARRAVAQGTIRCGRVRGDLLRRPPLCPGLPG